MATTGFPGSSAGKNLSAMQETLVWFLGGEVPGEGIDYPLQYSWASLVVHMVKNPPAMLIPGLGRSPGRGHGNPVQYSCLENPHGQRSLMGYSPCGCRVRHNWATKQGTTHSWKVVTGKELRSGVGLATQQDQPNLVCLYHTLLVLHSLEQSVL